ncbi:MAG: hypothetical protein ACRDHE_11445 [Ktedonobacterales bacterium]
MARDTFNIAIGGEGVEPETLPFLELADYVKQLQTALVETALARSIVIDETPSISLAAIDKGASARAILSVPRAFIVAMVVISTSLSSGTLDDLPPKARDALAEASKSLAKRKHTLSFIEDTGAGIVAATISPEHPVLPRIIRYVQEFTTLHGTLMRIGGDEKATARIATERQGRAVTVTATLSKANAHDLGARLYEEVGVEGWAKIDPATRQIDELRIERILKYRKVNAVEAFDALGEAAAGRWDGVDSEMYIRELRGDEDVEEPKP